MSSKMTASALVDRLRASLVKPGDAMPGGIFMTEVALGARCIDGLYCGFFGSRGRHLRGYEVKVARSDWLHELEQPAKAEVWEQNVHEWWIVAPDTDVVRPEELPPGWGLLEAADENAHVQCRAGGGATGSEPVVGGDARDHPEGGFGADARDLGACAVAAG